MRNLFSSPTAATLGCLALALGSLHAPDTSALDPSKRLDQYGHRTWTVEDGLPSDTIHALAQTPDGYLWIGTSAGLTRTDGVRFVNYGAGELHSLGSSVINALAVTEDGALWIATNAALVRHVGGRFERVDERLELRSHRFLSLHPGADGDLWVGTYGDGLLHLSADGTARTFGTDAGLPELSVWSLELDPTGRLWFAPYVGGLFVVEADGETLQPRPMAARREEGIAAIWATTGDAVWVGAHDGLHRLRDGGDALFDQSHGLGSSSIWELLRDRQGNHWVGTESAGLYRFHPAVDDRPAHFEHFDRSPHATSAIDVLFEDAEGHLWAGTRNAGLLQILDGPITVEALGPAREGRATTSVHCADDGTLWAATARDGLWRLDPDGERRRFGVGDGLPAERLWAVTDDGDGGLWIGTSGAGLLHRDAEGAVRQFTGADGVPDVVFGLHRSGDTLWLASNSGAIRYRDGVFETLDHGDGLASDQVRAIHRDGSGDVWIGTAGGGLHRLRDGAVERWGTEDGLASDLVWSLYEDRRGTLWVGTDLGLARRDGDGWKSLGPRQGLLAEGIGAIREDDRGNLWLATRRGILHVAREQLDGYFDGDSERVLSHRYGRADGLLRDFLWPGIQPAACDAGSGRLWFAMSLGLASVPSTPIRDDLGRPVTRVEGVEIDAEPVADRSRVVVPPEALRLEIDYTALSFRAPHRLSFRHRLLDFDAGWVEAGHRRRATYTHLPPGDYVFEVVARHEDGLWHDMPTSLAIRVEPHIWETPEFAGALLVALGGLIFAGLWWRDRSQQRREQELRVRVDEALARVKTLSGLVPICSSCKKIRDDKGYWNQLESYLARHSEAELSHGLCPDCVMIYYEEIER